MSGCIHVFWLCVVSPGGQCSRVLSAWPGPILHCFSPSHLAVRLAQGWVCLPSIQWDKDRPLRQCVLTKPLSGAPGCSCSLTLLSLCLELPKASQETTEITCALQALKGSGQANCCKRCKQQGVGCHFPCSSTLVTRLSSHLLSRDRERLENIGPLGLIANSTVPVPALLMIGSQRNPDNVPVAPPSSPSITQYLWPRPVPPASLSTRGPALLTPPPTLTLSSPPPGLPFT